jgi:hypothetical protein
MQQLQNSLLSFEKCDAHSDCHMDPKKIVTVSAEGLGHFLDGAHGSHLTSSIGYSWKKGGARGSSWYDSPL